MTIANFLILLSDKIRNSIQIVPEDLLNRASGLFFYKTSPLNQKVMVQADYLRPL